MNADLPPAGSTHPQSPYQFATFRWLLGLYLVVHFLHLLPWAPELFSVDGVLPDPSVSPLHGLFPNLLAVVDRPLAVQGFIAVLAAVALAFAVGVARPAAALVLWYGWTCLFHRNVLISNPGLPYIGLILVLCALVPRGEGLSWRRLTARPDWVMPIWLWRAAFLALMAGYSYSGAVKLASPSWVNGEALAMLVTNPLARDWFVRDLLVALPAPLLQTMTWLALAGELLALPLALVGRTRLLAWGWMLALHLGIVLVVDFADLTAGMILAHLFVFDPRWLPAPADDRRRIVFFDGVCALCDGTVRFLIGEDRGRRLRYAPLQGSTAAGEPAVEGRLDPDRGAPESLIYVRGIGSEAELLTHSDGVFAILADLGGFWRLLSIARFLPRALRNALYRFIAAHRYRWFGKYESCRLPAAGQNELFLD